MRSVGSVYLGAPVPQARITTWWHGRVDSSPATWSSRNVASLTDNGVGDTTVTFRTAYQATPAVMICADKETTTMHTPTMQAPSASSVRIVTYNTSAVAAATGKVSLACVGDF